MVSEPLTRTVLSQSAKAKVTQYCQRIFHTRFTNVYASKRLRQFVGNVLYVRVAHYYVSIITVINTLGHHLLTLLILWLVDNTIISV